MIRLADEAETLAFGRRLAGILRRGDVVTLAGGLGAGKTTLARGILAGVGFSGDAPSPSFPVVIAYHPPEVSMSVTHADLYRIEAPDELEELALDDAVADGALLVEWPERLGALAWPSTLALTLTVKGDQRVLTASATPGWEGRWPLP